MTAVTTRLVAEGDVAVQSASVRQRRDHLLFQVVDDPCTDQSSDRTGVTA